MEDLHRLRGKQGEFTEVLSIHSQCFKINALWKLVI